MKEQKEKQLLLVDLCARLPYGIKCYEDNVEYPFDIIGTTTNNKEFVFSDGYERSLKQIKPYLRPMSSMTEEERRELLKYGAVVRLENGEVIDVSCVGFDNHAIVQDYLISHHFDYRGLIEKDLAIGVTDENNPYKE